MNLRVNKTFNNILYFFIAVVVVNFFSVFKFFFLAKLLEPSDYGVWITLSIVASYTAIGALGSIETLQKQVPFFLGRGELDRAREVESSVLGCVIFSACMIVIAGFAATLIPVGWISESAHLLRLIIPGLALSYFSTFFYYRCIAHQDFKKVCGFDSARSFFGFLLMVAMAYMWGLLGVVIGFVLCEIIVCCYSAIISLKNHGFISPLFGLRLIVEVVRIGLPISLIWWVVTLQMTSDRIIISSILGKEATGFYALGISVANIFILVPQVLMRVLYPRINEKLGETSDAKSLAVLVLAPTRLFSLILPVPIGFALFALPILFTDILPKYGPGLAAGQILLVAVFFTSLIGNGLNFLIATQAQFTLMKYLLISFATNVTLSVVLLRFGHYYIEAVAVSTGICSILLAGLVWQAVFKAIGYTVAQRMQAIFHHFLPIFLLLLLILVPKTLFGISTGTNGFRILACGLGLSAAFFALVILVPTYRAWIKDLVELIHSHLRARLTTA